MWSVVLAVLLHRASGGTAECPENCTELGLALSPGIDFDHGSCTVEPDGRCFPPLSSSGTRHTAVVGGVVVIRITCPHSFRAVPVRLQSHGHIQNKQKNCLSYSSPALLQVAQRDGAPLQLQRPTRRRVCSHISWDWHELLLGEPTLT